MRLAEEQVLKCPISVHLQLCGHGLALHRLPLQLLLLLEAYHLERPHLPRVIVQPCLKLLIAHLPHFYLGTHLSLLSANSLKMSLQSLQVSLAVLTDGILERLLSKPTVLKLLAEPRDQR